MPMLAFACGTITTMQTVDAASVARIAVVQPTRAQASTIAIVCNSGGLNVRSGAGLNYGVNAVLTDGSAVEIIGTMTTDASGEQWQQIEDGWVDGKYLCQK